MFLHHVGIGRLRVFHQRAAAIAVDVHCHEAAIKPGHAQGAQEGVRRLLPLEAGVVARAVARLMQLVERSGAQERIVIRENPFVMAQVAIRRVKLLMVRAALEMALGIIDHPRPTNNCAIVPLVAQVCQLSPARRVGLGNPQVIHPETPRGIGVTKHHHALAPRRVIGQQRREARRGSLGVGGCNVKRSNAVRGFGRES